jgi:signal transduction histidine kinase
MLDRVAAHVAALDASGPPRPSPPAGDLVEGIDIGGMVGDYELMRTAVTGLVERVARPPIRTVAMLDRAINDAIAEGLERYAASLRDAAERTALERRFLADATIALSSVSSLDETLDQIARLAVSVLGDWCVIDLIESSDVPRRVSVVHRDPATTAAARDWASMFPTDRGAERGISQVIRTGDPEIVSEVRDELLVGIAETPEYLDALRALGVSSYMILPLAARGKILGTLALVAASPAKRFGTADVGLATELARRTALAVDNALLYADSQLATRAREQLLAIVSHDLRNPLGAIGIVLALLRDEHAQDARMAQQLDIAERSVERMKQLIGDLLDTSAIQSGTLAIAPRPTEAALLVAEALDAHRAIAADKRIAISSECNGAMVRCDPDRIAQVLRHLLDNALKFCRSGDSISLHVSRAGDRARFVVSDTGPGIEKQNLPRLFEPYWSATPAIKQGPGLGLYISKGIVEAHGGTIGAESEPGHGTRITFTLPLAEPTQSS